MDEATQEKQPDPMLAELEKFEEQVVELVECAGKAMSAIGNDQWEPAVLQQQTDKYLSLVQFLQQGVEKHISKWEEQGSDGVGGSLYGLEKDAELSTAATKLMKERIDRLQAVSAI